MKKIAVFLSFAIIGCATSKTVQNYPHYHATPIITQGVDENTYWESEVKFAPRYPQRALTNGISGCAHIGFTITPEGTIADPHVIKSSPAGVFDQASIEAALRFTYKPSSANTEREAVISSNIFTYGLAGKGYEELSAGCR